MSSAAALADLVGIPGIESHWKLIGLRLGVSEDALDAIDKKHSKNSNRCKQLMFEEAVKRGVTLKEVLDTQSTLHKQEVSESSVFSVFTTMNFIDVVVSLTSSAILTEVEDFS